MSGMPRFLRLTNIHTELPVFVDISKVFAVAQVIGGAQICSTESATIVEVTEHATDVVRAIEEACSSIAGEGLAVPSRGARDA